jgi:indolepyruvate ferredoxin oxidoreductase
MSATLRSVSLDERYTADAGPALLSGTQALVRLLVEQRRLDRRRALDSGLFVSGYPGSPLGGLDRELERSRRQLEPEGIVFQPGVNEELAATAVSGTQLVGELPGRRHDGVVGVWFGKAPGLDRAADAIRHGNVSGTAHLGGALALIGDDPTCKSSTLPSSCLPMCESLALPVVAPGRVEDVVRLGLHAIALSRHAGLWTAMQIVSHVADASAAVELGAIAEQVPLPPGESRGAPPVLLGESSVSAEHDLIGRRLELAREYGREQRLNRIVLEPRRPRIALVAAGATFAALRRALLDLRLDDAALDRLGVRVVELGMPWPVHPDDVRAFGRGLEQILVFEDKRGFVETQIRDALYRQRDAPLVLGKQDEQGRELVPLRGAVDAEAISRVLGARLGLASLPDAARERIGLLEVRQARGAPAPLPLVRKPFFCSGCPHNLSTRAAPDQLVGAGIGCHSLVALDAASMRGSLLGAPQMGGEGAQWNGMAPFTDDPHYVQNLGDGTFHHSGSLAIRAAVAAGVNLTYKLLYNDAVAMTGGQRPAGRMEVATLTRWLETEGVARVIVTSEEPGSFAGAALAAIAEVRHRDRYAEAEAELARVPGVTVLIHTDRCATEERRMRKRGKLPTPAQRVWINERVCEGCGDCGEQSSCLSVQPVDTELGRKTQIHQSSCTQDFTCVRGDCPSFVLVTPAEGDGTAALPALPVELPEPRSRLRAEDTLIRMPGIGGTGVVTVSQILQMAALLDGRWSAGLDQTGLAQKGGPVVSDIRIAATPPAGALAAATGTVDVLLALDLLGSAAPGTLRAADRERTIAIVNTHETPPADMVTDWRIDFPPAAATLGAIEAATRPGELLALDAQAIAERLFGDHMPANTVALGAAYQHGCLPVSGAALEEAIRLNGAAVETNLAAFRWGRAAAVDPAAVEAALAALEPVAPPVDPQARRLVAHAGARGELGRLLEIRVGDLIAYQSVAYARTYLDAVTGVARREAALDAPGGTAIAEAFARGLHKLMAYKDEYEVARLHLDGFEQVKRRAAFGPRARAQVVLHPPALRALGLDRKIKLGRPAVPLFRALHASRRLRGTPLDPFGRGAVRRLERELVGEYRALVEQALSRLTPATHGQVAAIAALPDLIRGYERIKLANVERYRAEAARLLRGLGDGGDA